MYTSTGTDRARWSVIWVYQKGGRRRRFRKDFGDDLASAEALYLKAVLAKKSYATLVCTNLGFPPPVDLRPRDVMKKGRDRRTKKIRKVTVHVQPLKELNMGGQLWCPYCRTLRKFSFTRTAEVDGIVMEYPRYVCPICGISHKDHNVARWNPTAAMHMANTLESHPRSTRRSLRRKRRRARA